VTVFLNGSFLPLEQAKVSPLDRGFLFGDGIYEVIPSYRGVPFLLDAHLERLRRSLSEIRLADPMGEAGWREMLEQLLALNPGGDRGIYLQVTRGVAPRDHAFPAATEATVFAMVNPIQPPRPELAEQGVGAILLPDERWGRCDIKAVTLLANVLARQTAFEQGAIEAILLREGRLTEGAASNVFVVRGGVVRTPPLDRGILPGITRRFVLDLLEGQSRPVFEETVAESDLRTADEIWLTSSTKEILAVTRLDGQPVGSGRPGPVWRETLDLYQRVKNESLGAVVRENGDD
jgi:D-alanine transaminase